MSNTTETPALTPEGARREVVARLRARRAEIEDAFNSCLVNCVTHPTIGSDPDFLEHRGEAIEGMVDMSLQVLESAEDFEPPPLSVSSQWQRGARLRVSLDEIFRAYTAGYAALTDLMMEEAHDLPREVSREMLKTAGLAIERLMAMVADVYEREDARVRDSRQQRSLECAQRLLAGARVDRAELGYKLDAWHLGVIVTGVGTGRSIRSLAARLGRELLLVCPSEETLWAWLGGARRLASSDLEPLAVAHQLPGASLAVGEPSWGPDGWRLTHQQARAAQAVGLKSDRHLTRYADCPLLAAALQDNTLRRSLADIYLSPLTDERDGGALLRQTLRAYFAVDCNAATAASLLGVDRHTVARRLQKVEQCLNRPLHTCRAGLEVALQLSDALDTSADQLTPRSQ